MKDAGDATACIAALAAAPWYRGQIAAVHVVPAREARTVEPPAELRAPVREWLRGRGIDRLYVHQAEAIRHVDPADQRDDGLHPRIHPGSHGH